MDKIQRWISGEGACFAAEIAPDGLKDSPKFCMDEDVTMLEAANIKQAKKIDELLSAVGWLLSRHVNLIDDAGLDVERESAVQRAKAVIAKAEKE